jgi:hypothetical protein
MTMNTSTSDLAQRFRELSDDELLSRSSSGDLTEDAQAIAIAELGARGLPLPAAISASPVIAAHSGDLETVARYMDPTQAHIVRSCLEAAGVPAVIADDNLVRMLSILSVAVGGVRILVPVDRLAEAREVIAAFNRGDFALREGVDPGDE